MPYFLDVLLPIRLEKLFTYQITEAEASFIQPGMRIAVPFGKSKTYAALALKVHKQAPELYEPKAIHQILDEDPVVDKTQLDLWHWISTYYMCTLGEVMRSAIPSGFMLESETYISKNKEVKINELELPDDQFLILEALGHQAILSVQEITKILDKKNVLPIIKKLLDQGLAVLHEEIREKYKPKLIRYIRLSEKYQNEKQLEQLLNTMNRAPKQLETVLMVFQLMAESQKPIKASDITKKNSSSTILKALIDKSIIEEYYLRQNRVIFENDSKEIKTLHLNDEQVEAYNSIKSSFSENKPCLLFGVTASGKTEVYIKHIENALSNGNQVLYLLPEIALTSQLINRLRAYFGEKVIAYHSKNSIHEQIEAWNAVLAQSEKAKIVLGARSSIFLPFKNLGLIIIDEEHESSFKQFDPAPRYHARDTAMVLAKLHHANVILGSATPSIETFKNTVEGKFTLARLTKRFSNILMPSIELVDIKVATKKKQMSGHFSDRLKNEIQHTLENGEQVILFQNRRGYAPIVECSTCGHSPQCPNCDVSLTYHQYKNQLRCHYCGYFLAMLKDCMACGNATLDTKGLGTEQVQIELNELFPNAEVGRMDLDTTRGKYAYEKIISAFELQELDILVGTQMVTKGLDFRNVSLVGIMNADTLLNFPDYRAHERSFQMLTQVAGRAGRTKERGKVLIQTYNPYHQILQQVSVNDYKKMYDEQLYERQQFLYPPINKIIRITIKDRDYNKLNEAADWFASVLRERLKVGVLGPEYPPVARIRREYIKNILIKISKEHSLSKTKNSIKRIEKSFNAISKYKSIRLVYNVDHI